MTTTHSIAACLMYVFILTGSLWKIFGNNRTEISHTRKAVLMLLLRSTLFCWLFWYLSSALSPNGLLSLALLASAYFLARIIAELPGEFLAAFPAVLFAIAIEWASGWPVQRRLANRAVIDGQASSVPNTDDLVGRVGLVLQDLRPAGRIRVEDRELEAISDDGFVSQGEEVEVIGRRSFSVLVRKAGKNEAMPKLRPEFSSSRSQIRHNRRP